MTPSRTAIIRGHPLFLRHLNIHIKGEYKKCEADLKVLGRLRLFFPTVVSIGYRTKRRLQIATRTSFANRLAAQRT